MIEFRALRKEELPAWYAHCQEVFVRTRKGYFEDHFAMDPCQDTDLIFVAMDGDIIAATVRVFDRHVWIDGRDVHMGGIGEVSTKAAYRRKGLAGQLLSMALLAMEARGMTLSILFGDAPLYERMGYRFRPIHYARMQAAEATFPAGHAIRPFALEDLPWVMGLYDLFAGRVQGAVIRSEAYWTRWVLPQWKQPQVLTSDGVVIGYFTGEKRGVTYAVDELCAAPDAHDLVLQAAAQIAYNEGCPNVQMLRALVSPNTTFDSHIEPQGMMVRLVGGPGGTDKTEALAESMGDMAGMFLVDGF